MSRPALRATSPPSIALQGTRVETDGAATASLMLAVASFAAFPIAPVLLAASVVASMAATPRIDRGETTGREIVRAARIIDFVVLLLFIAATAAVVVAARRLS